MSSNTTRRSRRLVLTRCYIREIQTTVELFGWIAREAANDPNFLPNIIWTDESNFSNNGMMNRKNNHFWSKENPHIVVEGQNCITLFSINYRCGILNNRMLAFHLYPSTLTGAQFLEEVLIGALEDMPIDDRKMYFPARWCSWIPLGSFQWVINFRKDNIYVVPIQPKIQVELDLENSVTETSFQAVQHNDCKQLVTYMSHYPVPHPNYRLDIW